MLTEIAARLRRLFCGHADIVDTAVWYTDRPPEFHCFCKQCGQTFPPPDKWVEMANRRHLHAVYFPHEPLLPAIEDPEHA